MAAISKQEDKFIRLEKLIDLGTKALRHKFNILLPPYKLQKQMETFKPNITHRISRQEFDRLYPQGGGNNLQLFRLIIMFLKNDNFLKKKRITVRPGMLVLITCFAMFALQHRN